MEEYEKNVTSQLQINVDAIDTTKLGKLEKLINKVDNDLKKKSKDITKPLLVELFKKSHEIYQIVLYEISDMLELAQLSSLRQVLTKIYNGQNNILNYLLKLNTNFEITADKMLENLSKNVGMARRKSIGSNQVEEKETQKVSKSIVSVQPQLKKIVRKVFKDQQTDTADDMKAARDQNSLAQKEDEIQQLAQEVDEGQKEIDDFLKNKKNELMALGESKAQNNLKDVLKDLGKKKREADKIENDANNLQDMQGMQKNQMSALQGSLIDGLKNMQKAAQEKALEAVKNGKAVYKNGQLIYLEAVGTETDQNYFQSDSKEKLDKQKRDMIQLEEKILHLEKQIKDTNREKEVLHHQVQELMSKVSNMTMERKKQEEKKIELKKTETTLSKQDSEKIKKMVEENIKMKLRIKTLMDSVADLEKEINRNYDRFKAFIMNSNMSDELKRSILNQAETLFKPDFTKRLNLNDMKELLIMESDFYKDPLFKSIVGSDITALTRNVKRDEQARKAKILKIPNYDPLFDAQNLNENEKIIVRKVKKIIERQNSQGQWVTEEVEVEEEVVVNEKTGEELRKRDKPIVISQSNEVKTFLDQHGGFAIGGSKINLPKKPVAKNGQEIKSGQWFEDKDGKKVRQIMGKDGEEVYEIEEAYVDENGVKKTRIQQMKIKKDKNGNEIIEEEIFDAQGKKQLIQKRIIKEKDGTIVTEEVITDEKGRKILKRQKVVKDKDGNDVIIEEITDSNGNKTIIKKKVIKDSMGNDVIIEERVDANGNKVITTIRKDEYGQEIVEQETIDRYGNIKRVEKKIIQDEDGNPIIQEISYDQNGKQTIKNIKIKKDSQGNEIIEEEIIGPDGKKQIKVTKRKKNADGTENIEEEIIDENGNVIVIKKKISKDKDGNIITEEERYDAKTGQKTVIKTKLDLNGKQTTEQKIIGKDGKEVNIQKTTTKDKDGNLVETEIRIDENGKKVNITKKTFRDKDGREIKEEVITDENGKQKIIRTKVIKDKDGNDIIEEVIIGADGTKIIVRKKIFQDKDGNDIIEEEIIDSNGNKTIKKIKKGLNGEEVIEETKIGTDGKAIKTIRRQFEKNGQIIVEETTVGADGKQTVRINKLGIDNKSTQTDALSNASQIQADLTLEQLLEKLQSMGIDKTKIDQLRSQIQIKQKIKDNKQKKQIDVEEKKKEQFEEEEQEAVRNASADSGESLETLDGNDNEDEQAEKLYDKMLSNKFGGMADLIRTVRNALLKQGNEKISLEEFKEYLVKMKQIHSKCGDNCPHLKRFYEKLGFVQKKYKRRFLKMKDTKIEAKKKLPQISQGKQ